MTAEIVKLGPHQRMTPEETLASAAQFQWERIIICGYHADNGELVVQSSHMTRECALWIIEWAKNWVMAET